MKRKILSVLAGLMLIGSTSFACIETLQPEYALTFVENDKNEMVGSVTLSDGLIAKVKVPTDKTTDGILTLSLPATISVQIGEFGEELEIDTIKLEYSSADTISYTVSKSLQDVSYSLKTNSTVPWFGLNTFDPTGFSGGDEVLIRIYVADDMYETYLTFSVIIDNNRRPV